MIFKKKNAVLYLQFPDLASLPGLFHAVFTRHGGGSAPPFDTLNISHGVGDDPNRVDQNREIIKACAGIGEPFFMEQVHGTNVLIFKNGEEGSIPNNPEGLKADAAVTNIPGILLTAQVADCQPILLFDPVNRVAAIAHAGWRGSIQRIVEKTVHSMIREFDTSPGNLIACIGPSLGPCCAEFVYFEKEIPRSFWAYKDLRNRFDFWSISRDQLINAGLFEKNIHNSGLCTRCRPDLFFSYRREKHTGRFVAAIGLQGG